MVSTSIVINVCKNVHLTSIFLPSITATTSVCIAMRIARLASVNQQINVLLVIKAIRRIEQDVSMIVPFINMKIFLAIAKSAITFVRNAGVQLNFNA